MSEYGDCVEVPKALLLRDDYYSTRDYVLIDRCMAPLVIELNKRGIETINCCCGHGKTPPSMILCLT
jgi:hypothetical protein